MSNSTNDQNLPEVVQQDYALADMSRIEAVGQQLEIIKKLVDTHMIEGEDYGIIPGVKKKSLFQSGAEKLNLLFNAYAEFETTLNDLGNGHREYITNCKIISRATGKQISSSGGSCSTLEVKYRYREAQRKCPKCGKEAIIKGKEEYGGGYVCFEKKGGCKTKFKEGDKTIEDQLTGRVENEDLAECYNTCLKMCEKRAYTSATKALGLCSHLFTVDVEGMNQFAHQEQAVKALAEVAKQDKKPEAVKPKLIYSYYVDELDDVDKKAIWAEAKTLCGEYKDGLLWTSVGLSNKWKSILQTSKPIASKKADVVDAEFVNPFRVEKTFADDELPENFNSK